MTSYPIKVQSLGSCTILVRLLAWLLHAPVSNYTQLCNCNTYQTSAMQLSVSDTEARLPTYGKQVVLKFQFELGRI